MMLDIKDSHTTWISTKSAWEYHCEFFNKGGPSGLILHVGSLWTRKSLCKTSLCLGHGQEEVMISANKHRPGGSYISRSTGNVDMSAFRISDSTCEGLEPSLGCRHDSLSHLTSHTWRPPAVFSAHRTLLHVQIPKKESAGWLKSMWHPQWVFLSFSRSVFMLDGVKSVLRHGGTLLIAFQQKHHPQMWSRVSPAKPLLPTLSPQIFSLIIVSKAVPSSRGLTEA